MSSVQGNIGAKLQNTEQEFDPRQGLVTIETWTGLEGAIRAKRDEFASYGWRSTIRHRGPLWMCRVIIPGDEGEQPTYLWSIITSWREVDIWRNPKIQSNFSSADDIIASRLLIDKALKDTVHLTVDAIVAEYSLNEFGRNMYVLLKRGVEVYRERVVTLRRRMALPAQWTAPSVIHAVPRAYTWASLVATFAIPAIIANNIPGGANSPLPTAPADLDWAWIDDTDESDVTLAINKTEEVKDWIHGAVSYMMYEVYSGRAPL